MRPPDFESGASASSATPAQSASISQRAGITPPQPFNNFHIAERKVNCQDANPCKPVSSFFGCCGFQRLTFQEVVPQLLRIDSRFSARKEKRSFIFQKKPHRSFMPCGFWLTHGQVLYEFKDSIRTRAFVDRAVCGEFEQRMREAGYASHVQRLYNQFFQRLQ